MKIKNLWKFNIEIVKMVTLVFVPTIIFWHGGSIIWISFTGIFIIFFIGNIYRPSVKITK